MKTKTTIKKPVKKIVHHISPAKKITKPEKVEKKIEKKIEKPIAEKPVMPISDEAEIFRAAAKTNRYWEAVGRRKTAVARVRLFTQGDKVFMVNGKLCVDYFPILELRQAAESALQKMKCLDKFRVSAVVKGGGVHAQAEAIRHATSRALTIFNADFRKRLKKAGFLTRDPRMRERKKFGLKRARRAPQWKKR